jgi:hypothetical protein
MNTLLPAFTLACLFSVLGGPVNAVDGLENGDFSKGKSKWMGDGQVVYLRPDGSITPTDDSKPTSLLPPAGATTATPPAKNIPIIEIKLKLTQFADFYQKFKTVKEMDVMNAEITYKTSSDFVLNEKATVFNREITWGSGTYWYWTALVFPKIDLMMRLDKRDNHMYKLQTVKAGGDWQTMKVSWKDVGGGQDASFHVLGAPGHGSLYLKSVVIKP